MAHFIIEFHISLVKAQTNYFNNNLLTLDVKLLIKIMKLYYLKALIDGQGKIKIYYGMSRVKKHPSGKRSIMVLGKLPPERLPPPPPPQHYFPPLSNKFPLEDYHFENCHLEDWFRENGHSAKIATVKFPSFAHIIIYNQILYFHVYILHNFSIVRTT